jgi:hypothetical protein
MNRKHNLTLFFLGVVALGAIFTVACRKYKQFQDVILVTGTETDNIIKFTVENTPAAMNVTASATGIVSQDITVNFAVDTSLVSKYNSQVNGNYFAAPANTYTISATSGVIKTGTNVSAPITVTIVSFDSLHDGRSYLIPVTIKSVTGPLKVLETSRTVFLKIARVTLFNSIDLSNYNFYDIDTFATPITNITQFTFEVKCYIQLVAYR